MNVQNTEAWNVFIERSEQGVSAVPVSLVPECVSTGYVTHAVGGTNACLLVPSDNGLGLDPQFPGWLLGKGLREMRFPKSHTLLYSADGFDLVGKSTNNRGRRWRVMHVLPQKAACCAVRS